MSDQFNKTNIERSNNKSPLQSTNSSFSEKSMDQEGNANKFINEKLQSWPLWHKK